MSAMSFRAIGAVAALIFGASAAAAQAPVCMELEARLAQLQNASATFNGPAQYDEPINRQRGEINNARNEARRANCTGGFLFFQQQNRHPKCDLLMNTIRQMEQNLNRLETARNRSQFQGGGQSGETQQILQLLARNRCGPQYANYGGYQQPNDNGSGFFGPRTWWNSRPFGSWGMPEPRIATYRTLCVRTCDGYYFPISFSTVNSRFAQDEQSCRSMCPGADVALYIHHNPGQESESMVSLAGEPYSALPTAFLYRDQYISACSCGRPLVDYAMLQQQQQVQITVAGVPVQGESPQFLPVPFKRPMPSEDPETIANRRGEFTAEPPQVSIPGAMAVLIGPDGKRVRVVGPSYYYAQ